MNNLLKSLARLLKGTSSAPSATALQSPIFTLTEPDKKRLLTNHLTNALANIFLEEIKLEYIGTKRLTNKAFADLWDMQGRKVAAMKDEADHLAKKLGEL